ncbi:MAG TPA: hypothetical protein VGN88_04795, partial [Phycisphaerae bacterium]
DNRQLARDLLSGTISVDQAVRLRHSSSQPVPTPSTPATAPPPLPSTPPIQNPTITTKPPESNRKFPCKQCGARLDFDPSQRALKCPYCGFLEEIAPAKLGVVGGIVEHDYAVALAKVPMDRGTIAGRSSEVRCPGCGANVLIEDNVETDKCPFCATHLVNAPRTSATEMICPESVLPFHITDRQAREAFNAWIKSRWFAPNNLKQLANLGQLSGIYLPFWTYDSMTYTHYTGQRGDDYWENETYTTTENGQSVTRTRQVRRTRWTYVAGEVDHFFDDVLVCASRSVPVNYVTQLEPWDLAQLEGFRPEFLASFKTERYVVTLSEGFGSAKQIMEGEIRRLCCQNIGGDHQQLVTVATQHVGVTFKHILLPMWLAVYRYQNATYRILVNARSGEVQGARPYSWAKITLAIVAGLLVTIIIILIAQHSQGSR